MYTINRFRVVCKRDEMIAKKKTSDVRLTTVFRLFSFISLSNISNQFEIVIWFCKSQLDKQFYNANERASIRIQPSSSSSNNYCVSLNTTTFLVCSKHNYSYWWVRETILRFNSNCMHTFVDYVPKEATLSGFVHRTRTRSPSPYGGLAKYFQMMQVASKQSAFCL